VVVDVDRRCFGVGVVRVAVGFVAVGVLVVVVAVVGAS
jgi:hypothetical protein